MSVVGEIVVEWGEFPLKRLDWCLELLILAQHAKLAMLKANALIGNSCGFKDLSGTSFQANNEANTPVSSWKLSLFPIDGLTIWCPLIIACSIYFISCNLQAILSVFSNKNVNYSLFLSVEELFTLRISRLLPYTPYGSCSLIKFISTQHSSSLP